MLSMMASSQRPAREVYMPQLIVVLRLLFLNFAGLLSLTRKVEPLAKEAMVRSRIELRDNGNVGQAILAVEDDVVDFVVELVTGRFPGLSVASSTKRWWHEGLNRRVIGDFVPGIEKQLTAFVGEMHAQDKEAWFSPP
ncbi:unnamed protein product [Heligmosomoides polygyrus]|uniref:SCP2 domain-containing protein n=1 Tax=Heligmosomoides polygyrus TaxID=6339 RepID=A0A183F453_HELPZ|nr:unnamed protein product [Heligmosomoides polygyrus]